MLTQIFLADAVKIAKPHSTFRNKFAPLKSASDIMVMTMKQVQRRPALLLVFQQFLPHLSLHKLRLLPLWHPNNHQWQLLLHRARLNQVCTLNSMILPPCPSQVCLLYQDCGTATQLLSPLDTCSRWWLWNLNVDLQLTMFLQATLLWKTLQQHLRHSRAAQSQMPSSQQGCQPSPHVQMSSPHRSIRKPSPRLAQEQICQQAMNCLLQSQLLLLPWRHRPNPRP